MSSLFSVDERFKGGHPDVAGRYRIPLALSAYFNTFLND
jgi:hypothetical protein